MNILIFTSGCNAPRRQQGVVLIVVLIFMLLLTIVGMAAIRGSGMQELMAGNVKDRNLAFQSAEASLIVAEGLLAANTACTVFDGTDSCYEDQNAIAPIISWTEAEWANNSQEANVELNLNKKPRYAIERLVTDSPISASAGFALEFDGGAPEASSGVTAYRVTSLGYGASASSQVILQATYRIKNP